MFLSVSAFPPPFLLAVGVLGGSVSSCHGLDATTAHPLGNPIGPNCYPHRVFAWLNDVFPHPANELTNGACEFKLTSNFFPRVFVLLVRWMGVNAFSLGGRGGTEDDWRRIIC